MIRLKNNVLPVWLQWDGDEEYFERAKQTIIEDIKLHGFDHYTAFADIHDEPEDEDKDWDGAPAKEPTKKATPKKAAKSTSKSKKTTDLPSGKPNLDTFASDNKVDEVSTDFDTSKTAS